MFSAVLSALLKGIPSLRLPKSGSVHDQASKTVEISCDQSDYCNGKKSVLGDDVQNTVDFITKDSSNYINQPPCAAPTCTCMIHVGIISFGPILVVLRARYERSWAVMMKKRSGDRIKKM